MRRSFGVVGAVFVLALLAISVLAGCGSGSGSATTGSSDSSGSGNTAGIDLNALFSAAGYQPPPPKTSPKPEAGKEIALLSCGQTVEFCKNAIKGAENAAASIGWSTRVIDSKGDANVAQTGLRQAIAAGVDGIYVEAFDCQYIKSALQEAKEAGIPVVAEESRDCDENLKGKVVGGPKLITATVNYPQGTWLDWLRTYGHMQAEYMLAKTGGDLKAVSFSYSDLAASVIITEAFDETLAKCDSCENVEETFTVAEAGSSLQEKAQQALLKNPNANYVRVDSDGTLINGVYSAIEASHRDLGIMASEGSIETMNLAREGKAIAGIGIPVEWFGYAAVDILNREFHGEGPAPAEGPGLQVWDTDHNVPPSGPYVPPINFEASFEKAWGVR